MQHYKFVNWWIRGFVFDVTNRLEGTSSARFSARKLIYGAFISTFLSPLHERGCSLRLCWGWMTHIIRGRLLGLLTLASSSSLLYTKLLLTWFPYFPKGLYTSTHGLNHTSFSVLPWLPMFLAIYACNSMPNCFNDGAKRSRSLYRKVAGSNMSCLEAHAGFIRLLMKGIIDPYVLWPFDKKFIS